MKIKIGVDGTLFVDGSKKYCPLVTINTLTECGDWCAQFKIETYHLTDVHSIVKVELCQEKCWTTDNKDFTDERKTP